MSRREQREQKVSRRRFLGLALGGGVVGAAAVYGVIQLTGGDSEEATKPGTTTTTSSTQPISPTETIPADADSAYARIGRAYLQQTPEESSGDTLKKALPPEFSAAATPNWGALGPQVGDDYTKGEIVTLDGWRMSRTEARAAAYVALTSA